MRRQRPSEEDQRVWAAGMTKVTPLGGRPPVLPPAAPLSVTPVSAAPPETPPPAPARIKASRLAAIVINQAPAGLDRASWTRFAAGKLPIGRRLDLHARTADEAHRALTEFLLGAHAEGLRVVEVITGRGSGPGGGVLRRELPQWLNLPRLRPLLLAAAHPHAANQGAVLLLLRRAR